MALLLLVFIFIVVPLAELYVIIKVGEAIGWQWTLLILLADSIIGSMLLRSQGRTVWRRFRLALEEGRVPHREVLDGALVIFGGAFLITPGFITDVIGVLCLLPPTRVLLRRLLVRGVTRRFGLFEIRWDGRGSPPRDYDVEGTAYEHEPDQPRLER